MLLPTLSKPFLSLHYSRCPGCFLGALKLVIACEMELSPTGRLQAHKSKSYFRHHLIGVEPGAAYPVTILNFAACCTPLMTAWIKSAQALLGR